MLQVIDSGIPRDEIEQYFNRMGKKVEQGIYQLNECRIILTEGRTTAFMVRTIITFEGPQERLEEIVFEYRMAFLRGGA